LRTTRDSTRAFVALLPRTGAAQSVVEINDRKLVGERWMMIATLRQSPAE
jgi:hypothetical protein